VENGSLFDIKEVIPTDLYNCNAYIVKHYNTNTLEVASYADRCKCSLKLKFYYIARRELAKVWKDLKEFIKSVWKLQMAREL